MSDLSSIVHSAVSTLEKSLGTLCIAAELIKTLNSTYDPATGTNIPSSQSYPIKVVITGYTQFEIKGTDIVSNDAKVVMFKAETAPESGDTIIVGGDTFNILHSEPVYVGGTAAMYTLWCRR